MYDGPTTPKNFLVIDMGYSRANADLALVMFEAGVLNREQSKAFRTLMSVINAPNWRDSLDAYAKDALRSLNYYISTELDGDPNNGRGRRILSPSRTRYAS